MANQLPAAQTQKMELMPDEKTTSADLEKVRIENGVIQVHSLGDVLTLSKLLVATTFFEEADMKNTAQAMAKILFGQKMGLDPLESVNDLFVLKGQVSAFARLHARKIKASAGKFDYKLIKHDKQECTIQYMRDGKPIEGENTIKVLMSEMVSSGITTDKYNNTKTPWKVDPEGMLFNKNITRAYKRFFPDLYNIQVQTKEDMEEVIDLEESEKSMGETIDQTAEQIALDRQTAESELPDFDSTNPKEPAPETASKDAEEAVDTEIVEEANTGEPDKQEVSPDPDKEPKPDVQLEDKMRAQAAAQAAIGNHEAAEKQLAIAESLEKGIEQKQINVLLSTVQAKGYVFLEILKKACEKYGIDQAQWTKEMTKTQYQQLLNYVNKLPAKGS